MQSCQSGAKILQTRPPPFLFPPGFLRVKNQNLLIILLSIKIMTMSLYNSIYFLKIVFKHSLKFRANFIHCIVFKIYSNRLVKLFSCLLRMSTVLQQASLKKYNEDDITCICIIKKDINKWKFHLFCVYLHFNIWILM